jgi:hypothetical protein
VHHTIELAVPATATDEQLERLSDLNGVLNLSVERGASVKPPGDVITVHALNRAVDDVLATARRAEDHGPTAVATSGIESLVVSGAQGLIADDADESPWEEFERTLRHHGRISVNYLILMTLGGGVAMAGLLSPPVPQALALAASAVLAPAFEPAAKLAVALVRPTGRALGRSLVALAAGYAVLATGGAVTFLVLRALGLASASTLASSDGVHMVLDPTAADWLVAAGGALAGMVIVTSFRQAVLAGALIALALVPAAAVLGAGVVAGDPALTVGGLKRTAEDLGLVLVLGGAVVLTKHRLLHRGRAPLG